MNKEEIIREIESGNCDDWTYRNRGEITQKIEKLYEMPKDSIDYYRLKFVVTREMLMNCIALSDRNGKRTVRVFESLMMDLDALEVQK